MNMHRRRDDAAPDQLIAPNPGSEKKVQLAKEENQKWRSNLWWFQKVGAAMVSFWIGLLFLMVLGFGYSFFWTASSMIYLLMRKKVDEMDLDEVYLEESEDDDIFGGPPTTPLQPATTAPSDGGTSQLQESLSVRQDRPSPPSEGPPPTPPAGEPPTTPPPTTGST